MTTIREYSYTGRWADGSHHTDTVYVAHGDPEHRVQTSFHMATGPQYKPAVYDVQDYPNDRLAMPMDRKWAASWLRIRRLANRSDAVPGSDAERTYTDRHGRTELRIQEGWFSRRIVGSVPNMPVDAYAEDKIVLHGDGMTGYGRKYGETADGSHYQQIRLDASDNDDFHVAQECDEHGWNVPCTVCGHNATLPCPEDCDCKQYNLDCEQCQALYDCDSGACDCIDKLEQCGDCGRDLGDGDTVWQCMDGGEVYCDEHVIEDARPDELFKKVGGVRGAHLPESAWPGGYLIVYYTKDGSTVCADCADQVEVSDPAVEADSDEEMNCVSCEHAQSFHAYFSPSDLAGTHDVGPCDYDEQKPASNERSNNEAYAHCDCEGYFPPLCDDCQKPIDPALRAWWAWLRNETAEVTA